MTNLIPTTDENFERDVLNADMPVLVDYCARWCGPCKVIAPVLEDISQDYDGRIRIYTLDIDDNEKIAAAYRVRGVPTLMLFKGGEVEATKVGAITKAQVAAFLDSNL